MRGGATGAVTHAGRADKVVLGEGIDFLRIIHQQMAEAIRYRLYIRKI